ncbi:MAG: 3-oxoacyl-ACP reductase [Verrucomicrobia bacterium CG_4_10_14_3_um_filter_43_23]|nr:MAG: 3-oxoacyl-[acyl-carrier-protein] reductase [Verrucomicrobia bacterium CG1_02_43_26]PIP59870.1 MAG: 3-oxoacyl-ACP reductase [Verrucomicrobia bacterium CG22_combo_CG10-13_8_21_14_all_43_17]PIX58421.1 MAG: 3-oxoacyl-ACP reductase [Verrucomicrobia bacterium CG_4_10_14_3_um_filter_43_23]PIY61568.1 MAG: 3-oxoacyl-ACP reductase [Verrucomicrobia bacterium CG_4_10_14_0_8_um_filter_43_34]PJA43645.1 MAG: 3-oxoacyl-ACP reductase [Verrucomicrobia bacterium CG_4_9_14_3_um_filter_43_20]
MSLTFIDRKAVVTGAGRGIGKEIALKLAKAGVYVICVSQSATCEAVAEEIKQSGGRAAALKVDVGNSAAVNAACADILKEHECIDILVNNAGITRDGLLVRMSEEDWDAVIQTNLNSVFYWTKALLRPMTQKRWGRIVNVSSVVALMGNAGQANYCAAKAGMLGFTKSLAREVAARQITVNAIAPGFIQTDMTSVLGEKITDELKKIIPLKRMGTAADIAESAKFLASEEAGYITGQVLSVDGGMYM